MQEYHWAVLKNIEINNKVIPPPPTVALNNNNINLAQKAILEEYQTSDGAENPYAVLIAYNEKFHSLMHNAGFPKWGQLVGRQFVQNGQKLHKNYKINILEAKQANFLGNGGIPPSRPTRGNPAMEYRNLQES